MSASTPSTILATICVVDSSLALAVEWSKILSDYLTPIIQRLAELTANINQFRIGFITYGLASSRPSPLLCQRFFQPSLPMSKEMKEDPPKLCIGNTGIGSSSGGMAVLEGIVAALEMFDKLRQSLAVPPGQSQSQQPNKPPLTLVSHILHLAAAHPDVSPHPLWNANSKFDQLTWSTLPDELKQRQINYSVVTIRPIPRLKDIFLSANSTDATPPWFDVAPNHTIMLSGFPPKGLKRQTEPTTATPDPKRPRQDSTVKAAVEPSPGDSPPKPESATPPTNPATISNAPSFANLTPARQREFMEKFLKLQSDIKQEFAAIQRAQANGVPPEVIRPMRDDLTKKVEIFRRLNALAGQKKLVASTGTVPGPALQLPPPAATIPASTTASSTDPNPAPPAPESAQPPNPATTTTTTDTQNPNVPNSATTTREAYPPEVVAQIHRLMQQQTQQGLARQGGATQLSMVNNQGVVPRPAVRQQWHGILSSASANSTQETVIYVSVEFQPNSEPHTATWPQKIQISPASERAITPREFYQWASQNSGVLCRVIARRRPETPPNNEALLGQLINSLSEKSMYAVATWPLPNGARGRKTMILTAAGRVLIGAVFPLTGFSEIPKEESVQPQLAQQPGQQTLQQPVQQAPQSQLLMPPIPPELIPKIQMMRANMQARFGAAGRNVGLPLTGNIGDLSGLTPQSGAANLIGHHQQLPPGINLETMQALMQRKQDG